MAAKHLADETGCCLGKRRAVVLLLGPAHSRANGFAESSRTYLFGGVRQGDLGQLEFADRVRKEGEDPFQRLL